jgi:cold shock CspA family protein
MTYATVQFFDATRNLGMLVTTDGQRSATFDSAGIAGDPAQIRPGETVVFDEVVRDGHALVAVNIRRI